MPSQIPNPAEVDSSFASDPAVALSAAPGPVIASSLPAPDGSSGGDGTEGPKEGQSWWDWFIGKVEAAKAWAESFANKQPEKEQAAQDAMASQSTSGPPA